MSQARNIAKRIADWVDVVDPCPISFGYAMSGSWDRFYQQYFFPNKTLHVGRLNSVIRHLRELGYRASLDISPMENDSGLFMYMRVKRIL